jgi:hypothetical protein
MIGKFFVSSSYAVLYIYTTELFPTSVRSSCMGMCTMLAGLGSMVNKFKNNIYFKFAFRIDGTIIFKFGNF